MPDFRLARIGVLLQQPVGSRDHAGRAEAALQAMHLAETFLDGMQRAVRVRHALDGADVGAVRLDGKHRAGLY